MAWAKEKKCLDLTPSKSCEQSTNMMKIESLYRASTSALCYN